VALWAPEVIHLLGLSRSGTASWLGDTICHQFGGRLFVSAVRPRHGSSGNFMSFIITATDSAGGLSLKGPPLRQRSKRLLSC
jgi:hypothetical protein